MIDARTTQSSRRGPGGLVVVLLLVVLMSCTNEVAPPRPVSPELERLYSRIHECRHEYEEGLEQIAVGNTRAGRNLLEAATTRLRVAAEQCARIAECDTELFVDSIGRLYADKRPPIDGTVDVVDTLTAGDNGDPGSGPFVEAMPEIGRAVSLLHGIDLRQRIPLNDQVFAGINQWLTWNRPELMDAYENYQYLRDRVAPVYEEAGLPEALLFAIMAQETGAKVHAYSRAGAAGPLQFMGPTWLRYGLGSVDGFDMRLDPVAATRANVAYLNDQLRAFNDDLEKTLAAYNVGESRLRRLHRDNPGATFWDPTIYYSLPRETRNYVPQVLAAAWIFLNPQACGMGFPALEAASTTIVLEEEISLGELTVCLGNEHNPAGWFRTLRNLNPRRRAARRIPAGEEIAVPALLVPAYSARCVGDSEILALARRLHDADYPENPNTIRYTVRPGDTLAEIAARHRCSVRKLAALNELEAPGYVIHVGQRLSVPGGG